MQIVIDMPDDICNRIRHLNRCVDFLDACRDRDMFVEAIKNGIPLPEQLGQLMKDGIVISRNLCDSCINDGCIFQSVIVRSHCDFYKAESEAENEDSD